MPNEKHFAIRKVRPGGRVKIGGYWYRPMSHHLAYDGRMDGYTYLFGRYPAPWKDSGYESHINQIRLDPDSDTDGPEVVDGTLPWLFWDREED